MEYRRTTSREFRALERLINDRLKEFAEEFSVRHLTQGPDGKFRFELSAAVSADQGRVLGKVIREVLKGLPADRVVQAKFYLPESLADKVKKVAKRRNISQSALVAQCLDSALSARL